MMISGAPFTYNIFFPFITPDSTSETMYFRSAEKGISSRRLASSLSFLYSCPLASSHSRRAPSVGLPMTRGFSAVRSRDAVELTAMPSNTRGLMSIEHSFTCIWFCVSVPVLSVQMTVVAPIVSQACILRTRLLVFSIFRMELASDSDTAIGNPSGTATTTSATAIMMVSKA